MAGRPKKAQEVEDNTQEVEELEDGCPGKDWHNIAGEDRNGNPLPPVWVKRYIEGFHKVLFAERTNENDTKEVQLTVNGETLQIVRGKEVIVPGRFLECARHTKQPVYRQLPNEPRKITGYVQTYTYHIMEKDVGEQAYRKLRKAGDSAVKKYLESQELKE